MRHTYPASEAFFYTSYLLPAVFFLHLVGVCSTRLFNNTPRDGGILFSSISVIQSSTFYRCFLLFKTDKTVVSHVYVVAEYCTGLRTASCTVLSIFVCNSALSMPWRIDPGTKHPWSMCPDPEPQCGGMIVIATCFAWFRDTSSHHFIYLTVTLLHTGLYILHTVLYCLTSVLQ